MSIAHDLWKTSAVMYMYTACTITDEPVRSQKPWVAEGHDTLQESCQAPCSRPKPHVCELRVQHLEALKRATSHTCGLGRQAIAASGDGLGTT